MYACRVPHFLDLRPHHDLLFSIDRDRRPPRHSNCLATRGGRPLYGPLQACLQCSPVGGAANGLPRAPRYRAQDSDASTPSWRAWSRATQLLRSPDSQPSRCTQRVCMCHIISYALHGTATESEVDAMSNECYITIPGTRMYCIFFSETTATRSLQRRA